MTLIRSIGVGMHADTRDFTADVLESAAALDALMASLEATQSAASRFAPAMPKGSSAGGGGGTAELGAQFDVLAGRISVAMNGALAPLGTFAASFGRQFSQVGGTLVETAKRVAMASEKIVNDSNSAYLRELGYNRDVNAEILKALQSTGALAPKTTAVGAEWKAIDTTIKLAVDGVNTMTAAIVLATNQLDKFAAKMAGVAQAGKGPQLKMFDPSQLAEMERRAAASEKGGPKGPRTYHRDAQGRFSGAPLADLQKTTAATNVATVATKTLGVEATKTAAVLGRNRFGVPIKDALGPNTAHQVQELFRGLRESDAMAKKTKKSLASLSAGGSLNRAIQETSLLGAQFRTLSPVINGAANSAKRFGATLAVGLGLTAIGFKTVQGAMGFLKGSIASAAGMNETLSKTGVVFGDSTAKVTGQAEAMAKSFGLPKREMLDAASSIGLIGKGAGLATGQAATLANSMSSLAADASSFYNVPLDVALEKIRSGLVGQSEPLRAFGILMNEDAVAAEAVKMGLAKAKEELSEQTKVAARSSLIMKGLKDATGDLARTSDSAANMSRKFHGQVENLSARVGTALLPAMSQLLTVGSDAIDMLSEGFERFKSFASGAMPAITSGFELVGIAIRNLPDFLQIASLEVMEWGMNFVAILETIPGNLAIIGSYVAGNWRELMVDAFHSVGAVIHNLGTNLGELANSIFQFLQNPTQGIQFTWTPLLEGFKATAAQLPALLKPEVVSMQGEIDKLLEGIAGKEAARSKKALEATAPTLPEFGKNEAEGKAKKGKQDQDVGALELGSKEALSAIAAFRNQSGANEAKQTAKATVKAASTLDRILETISRNQAAKSEVSLIIANL